MVSGSLKLNINPISEAQIEKRKELEKKLQAEKLELEILEKSLNHINDATVRMTGMLSSFDSRLAKLESYIMPIHNSTQVLSRTNMSELHVFSLAIKSCPLTQSLFSHVKRS